MIFRTRTSASALLLAGLLLCNQAFGSVKTEEITANSEGAPSEAAVQPVPEPGTLILVGSTLLGFAYLSRRRSSSSS